MDTAWQAGRLPRRGSYTCRDANTIRYPDADNAADTHTGIGTDTTADSQTYGETDSQTCCDADCHTGSGSEFRGLYGYGQAIFSYFAGL